MKKYLLDTHIILWLASKPELLSKKAKQLLLNPENSFFVSAASAWEVAIKLSLNKLNLAGSVTTFYKICSKNSISLLGIEQQHLEQLANLPLIHKDPFDRLIIATALAEGLTLVTADNNIHNYPIRYAW